MAQRAGAGARRRAALLAALAAAAVLLLQACARRAPYPAPALSTSDPLPARLGGSPEDEADLEAACAASPPAGGRPRPPGFRFVHIMKTGTSFIITLRNALPACKVKDYSCQGEPGGAALGLRFNTSDRPFFVDVPDPDQHCGGALQACQGGEAYHRPLQPNEPNASFAFVTLLRRPLDRQVSLMRWACQRQLPAGRGEHSWQDWQDCWEAVKAKSRAKTMALALAGTTAALADAAPPADGPRASHELRQEAAAVGKGGEPGKEGGTEGIGPSGQAAFRRLLQLDFFGFTESWKESVCLFHATFGGFPAPAQFLNTRKTPLEAAPPPGFAERFLSQLLEQDQVLYELAVAEFERRRAAAAPRPCFRLCMARHWD